MKTAFAFLLSVVIMGVIFSRINIQELVQYFHKASIPLLILAILFFVPQVLLSAYRWKVMIRKKVCISLWESTRLMLACNALNILLPSRVGDLSKAYFMKRADKLDFSRGMNTVIFEKYIDLTSLGIVVLTGTLFHMQMDEASVYGLVFSLGMLGLFPILYWLPLEYFIRARAFDRNKLLSKLKRFLVDTQEYLSSLKENKTELLFIISLSIFLWFLHIFQFFVIFKCLHSDVSVFNVFRLVPLAILVGLIPVTIAGIGTRDSAMIYFFAGYESTALVVGVGLFASLRYFVPGLLGLPFLNRYIVKKDWE